ncbi:META domain-containing protein [Flavobacterium macacae]|uniref:META domain-containing protein n=2 Tax=Flavobacterium macacae TaxID=2488993 RepID=A0A3P3WE14_9FLAO|nr:META domain-containing protein [Flavobacterium macacae]
MEPKLINTMKTKFLAVICVIVLAGLQSCSCKKGAEAVTELSKSSWELAEINGKAINKPDYAKIPELKFDPSESRVSGNSGCNSISGTFKVEEDKITFGPLAQTKMACEGSGENQFTTAFNTVQKFKLGNKLYFYDGSGNKVLCFTKK